MSVTIRARYRNGRLEPEEKLNLAEGEEVTLTILDIPSRPDRDAFRRAAGAWRGSPRLTPGPDWCKGRPG